MSTCVVIHGTWGSRSDFGFADSLFCRAIKANLQHDAEFKRFEWSGSNSSIERTKAANRLCVFIQELTSDGAPIFIIAHSHGGNIAAEALRNDAIAQYVGGFITLGTPFLNITERGWISFLATLPGGMAVFAILMGSLSASIFAVIGFFFGMVHFSLAVFGASVICAVIAIAAAQQKEDIFDGIASLAESAASKLSTSAESPLMVNLLAITSNADEALWWLQWVISATNFPFMLFYIGLFILGWSTIFAFALILFCEFIGIFVNVDKIIWIPVPMLVCLGFGLGLSLIGIIITLLVKLVLYFVGTGPSSSFWTEILVRTKVNRIPSQPCITLEVVNVPIANIHGGLWHSKYTRSGLVVDHISQKISEWHKVWRPPLNCDKYANAPCD